MTILKKIWKLNLLLGAGALLPQTVLALSNFSATMDSTKLYYSFSYSGSPTFLRVYIDSDKRTSTGFSVNGIGADYFIENSTVYKFSGSTQSTWSWKSLASSNMVKTSSNMVKTSSNVKFQVARKTLGSPSALNVLANTSSGDFSAIVSQAPSSTTPTPTPAPPPPTTTTTMPTPTTTLPSQPTASISYSPNNAAIANPERGFFMTTDCRANPQGVAQLQNYKAQYGQTVYNCLWYLREFKNSPLTQTVLDQLQTQMNNMRTAGFKMILRLAYTNTDINDAPLSVVQGHLNQLAPIFQKNVDVIATVQAGIIGQWAEMSTSSNYGAAPFTATNWANRKAVIDKLLSVIPASRMVAVRTPEFKMQPYGSSPLSDSEAFNGSARARVSHYNDCFISSASDYGTYRGTADRDFLKQDSKYLAVSGETCSVASQNDCANAINEMSNNHWSLLHEGYNVDVINKWKSQGCFAEIKSRLGYRLQLQNATLSTSARVGGNMMVDFNIVNTGFASLYNERPVQLVLRNASTGAIFRLPLNADARRWLPGSAIRVSQTVTLPSTIPAGTYAILLALPDASSSLATRPEYSLQLANTGTWEASTGLNNLKANLVVNP